jgi:hypothetical protein
MFPAIAAAGLLQLQPSLSSSSYEASPTDEFLNQPQLYDRTAPRDRRFVPVWPESRADNLYIEHDDQRTYESCRNSFLEYDPDKWNTDDVDQELNNCYAHTFDAHQRWRKKKPQPGELSGLPALRPEQYTCKALRERILQDYPGVTFNQQLSDPCPCGTRRAWLGLDLAHPKPDYHVMQQHRDGTWSHKRGSLPVTRYDNRNRVITNPTEASWNYYPGYNYNTNCGFICIPRQ